MAKAYAMMRMPWHHARAIQMSLLTVLCASRSRMLFTTDVTGWLAKARTGPGIEPVSTKAELINGRR